MNIQKVENYEKKLFSFIDSYKNKIQKFLKIISKIVLGFTNKFSNIILFVVSLFQKLGKVMRYSTFPFHWIWIWLETKKVFIVNAIDELPFMKQGGHYFYGKPGSGKSTSVYHAIMQHAYYSGKASLTTAMMEMPRTDLSGHEYYFNQLFEPSDLFIEGVQEYGFPEEFDKVVYEEMLGANINQRNNKEKKYNNQFIPLIAAMGTQRHQGIELFYFISQLPKNDIQLMQMLTGYHIPKIKKGFDYKLWLNTGKIRWSIKGWYFESYDIIPKGATDYELVNKKVYFYPNTLKEDMKFFNRLNMREKYAALPKMKGVPMYS